MNKIEILYIFPIMALFWRVVLSCMGMLFTLFKT